MKELYIIRHGETELNRLGIVQGRGINAGLNEEGRRQAAAFFEAYHQVPFKHIYTSTLKRTWQTVEGFVNAGIPQTALEGLDELAWGAWEGQPITEASQSAFRDIAERWQAGDYEAKFEGGESPDEVLIRLKVAVQYILSRSDENCVLICMHGRAMRLLLCYLLGKPLSEMTGFPHQNTTLYRLKYENDMFELLDFNNTLHLKNKIKVSAVSYTNTKPFIYGLQHSTLISEIDLCLDIPSDCADKLINKQVDIGLIPVATIPLVPDAQIISSYCIGSVGAVNSVFMFSDVPVGDIKTVKLDPQSRTSNNLAKVLLKFHFRVDVVFTDDQQADTDAIVLIGDRTFGRKGDFPYVYDMGEEWMNMTGLPFVYAAWVANRQLDGDFITSFDAALKYGLAHRDEVIAQLTEVKGIDLNDYLYHKLRFELDSPKREALALFLNYIKRLDE